MSVFSGVIAPDRAPAATPRPKWRFSRLDESLNPQRDVSRVVADAVAQSPRASAHLAMLGDKRFMVPQDGTGFVMYRKNLGCHVAMGDPVGTETAEYLATAFVDRTRSKRSVPVFYQVTDEYLELYRSIGLTPRLLGQEAIVDLADFSLQGSHRARLRQTMRRTERAGGSMEVVPAEGVGGILPELAAISDAWLKGKAVREKGFSLGSFDPTYLTRTPVALVRVHGTIVAFANLWMGAVGGEVAVDLMRYNSTAPYGVMEYLFTKLFLWGGERGYTSFNLGMAPLAGVGDAGADPLSPPVWARVGKAVRDRGEKYYNFEGVRVFKDKFRPRWEPRYLMAPRGVAGPWAALSLAAMVAGGPMGVVTR